MENQLTGHTISKPILLILTFVFGGVGIHAFYSQRKVLGLLSLIFCWTFIPRVVSIIEFLVNIFATEAEINEFYRNKEINADYLNRIMILLFLGSFFQVLLHGNSPVVTSRTVNAHLSEIFNAKNDDECEKMQNHSGYFFRW